VPDKGGSFFDRQWRGELSLWLSYWVMPLPVYLVWRMLPLTVLDIVAEDDTFGVAVALTSAWLVVVAASVWYFVGAWRAAGNYLLRGGKARWAHGARASLLVSALVQAAMFIGVVIPDIRYAWAGDASAGGHRIGILGVGTELAFDGWFDAGAAGEIEAALNANRRVTLIHLNSPGGRIEEALQVRDLIAARGLNTYVDTECASACAFAFVGGAKRYLGMDAKLGYNSGHRNGLLTSTGEDESRDLLARGITPMFVRRVMATPKSTTWWPTVHQLLEGHVIDAVASVGVAKGKIMRSAPQNL
jgi:hypothetical protein